MSGDKITMGELHALFGDKMPLALTHLLLEPDPARSVADVRAALPLAAACWKDGIREGQRVAAVKVAALAQTLDAGL